jgi:ribonuclease III
LRLGLTVKAGALAPSSAIAGKIAAKPVWASRAPGSLVEERKMTNPKGDLIDYCRANGLGTPSFETAAKGPEHSPTFATRVLMGSEVWGEGQARTKKDAERSAALMALDNMAAGTPVTEASSITAALAASEDSAWPIFPEVLAEVLRVANSRVDVSKRGTVGVDEVRQLSLELYKSLLDDLGH